MLKLENAFLLDICLGYPFGKLWFPGGLPEAKPEDIPQTYLLNGEQLAVIKELMKREDQSVKFIIEGLRIEADRLLTMPNPSVSQKPYVSYGVQLNDYYSFAKYWWPNLESPDGLPYIRRDGDVNPECYSDNSDISRLESFTEASLILSIAAFVTGERSYANKASDLIYTWIVNPMTRQTPHFIHAQTIPGKMKNIRYQGLIESRRLIYVCDALQILRHMNYIELHTYNNCVQWFSELLNWIETSEQGQKAIKSKNNIGFWVDLQRLIYARFSNNKDIADKVLTQSIIPRIGNQVEEDGSLSQELLRAKPYDYVTFTLMAMTGLSAASKNNEIKLAEYSTDEGRSFQNAFNWFNDTIQSNGLQEKSLALSQLVLKQQENAYLRQKYQKMDFELQDTQKKLNEYLERYQELTSQQLIEETQSLNNEYADELRKFKNALQRVSNRYSESEKECARLRSDLNDNYRSLINSAFQYRGLVLLIKETSKTIPEKQALQKKVEEQQELLNKLNEDYSAERKLNQDLIHKLNKTEIELKEIKIQSKGFENERNRVKRRVKDIHSSRSWRYTEPIRKIARYLKRSPGKSLNLHNLKKNKVAQNNVSTSNPEPKIAFKYKKVHRRIDRIRRKLLNLGFTERAYTDLYELYEQTSKPYLRKLAAKELSLWHANQYTQKDAEQCLMILQSTFNNEKDADVKRQVAVLEAESFELVGDLGSAKKLIFEALEINPHADLYLSAANLETSPINKVELINQVLQLHEISKIELNTTIIGSSYDRLLPVESAQKVKTLGSTPKITVIMPVYNSEDTVKTALESVINQTWSNLEILVVDDCSSDGTVSVIEEYANKDVRVQLIKADSNGGPYVARNLALSMASGEFVTCHDADDWSHPEKLEKQALHLMGNPEIIGNTSEQARATSDLKFYRRGKFGSYIFSNMSSFMFRREPVSKKIGYWDSVRFGADSEFIRRIKKVFGDQVIDLPTGPLSFQRQSDNSLTGNELFGYQGYFMGARKEYFESHNYYHENIDDFYYEFPQRPRPFAIPEPMKPKRQKLADRRKFDVILVSDFRLDGGSTISSLEEIKAQTRNGLRTGLIQMSRYDYNPMKKINPKIRDIIDGDQVQMIVYGEKVSCDLLILRYPPILQEKQRFIPDVETNNVRVIVNQPPMSDYGENGELRYDIPRIQMHLSEYFGNHGTWHPIGPLIREALHKYHAEELTAINLSDDDWENIIHVDEWKRVVRPQHGGVPIIGRHSRDQDVKWPNDKNVLLSIYPDSDRYKVHVLGGAETPRNIIGKIPRNWEVEEFGDMHPKEFLTNLNVFVYYTHPDWVESFGRVIIEAMAVGVPVILPHSYKELFGDAAIYAKPSEVQNLIDLLMNDDGLYELQVSRAHDYVEKRFGYSMHALRLKRLLTKPGGDLLNIF